MATGSNSGGSNVYVATEVLPAAGGRFAMTLCNGLSAGVYNTDKIVWSSSSQWWEFSTTGCSTNYKYSESGTTDTIYNRAKDFVESTDTSTTDYNLTHTHSVNTACFTGLEPNGIHQYTSRLT